MEAALTNLKNIVLSYCIDDNQSRETLINSYTDLAKLLNVSEDATETLNQIFGSFADLDAKWPELFTFCGFDILESTIKLQILFYEQNLTGLLNLSSLIAHKSRPKEIQIQLNAVISFLSSQDESNDIEKLRAKYQAEKEDAYDIFKTILIPYVPSIFQKFATKDLSTGIHEFRYLLKFLDHDISRSHTFLGSNDVFRLFEILRVRKWELKQNAINQIMEFLLSFLSLYEKSAMHSDFKETLFDLIEDVCGNYLNFFGYWASQKSSSTLFSEGLSVLTDHICFKGGLMFPMIFSPLRRLQIFLPIVLQTAKSLPNTFLNVGNHCLNYFTDKFPKIDSPSVLVTRKMHSKDICVCFLDVSGGIFNAKIRSDTLKLFGLFMQKFNKHDYVILLKNVINIYPWDNAKGYLIDLVTKQLLEGFKVNHDLYIEILQEILSLRPLLDYLDSYLAAINLYRTIIAKCSSSGMNEELGLKRLLGDFYKELSILFDLDRTQNKVDLIIWNLQELENLQKVNSKSKINNN